MVHMFASQREMILEVLERGFPEGEDTSFNVQFATDLDEAAGFLAEDIEQIEDEWQGTHHDLMKVYAFINEHTR